MNAAKDIDAHCERRELDRALELAIVWTVAQPKNMKAWSKLSYVHELRRDAKAALSAIERAMEVSERPQPALYFNQGMCLFKLSEFALSVQAFQQCRDHDQTGYYTPSANLCLAKTYSVMGNNAAAAQHLETVNDEACLWLGGLVKASELRQQLAA